jgi:hypothetical protein
MRLEHLAGLIGRHADAQTEHVWARTAAPDGSRTAFVCGGIAGRRIDGTRLVIG